MINYIATFYTHFGAVSFRRRMASQAQDVRMMPVPRALSSSCGTCVSFNLPSGKKLSGELTENEFPAQGRADLEAVYEVKQEGYALLYESKEPS